jgi:hypothetical protein
MFNPFQRWFPIAARRNGALSRTPMGARLRGRLDGIGKPREFSTQPRIGQYSDGEATLRGILPQLHEWQFHARQDDVTLRFVRIPGRRRVLPATERDHEPHNSLGHEWYFEDSLAAAFDFSRDRWMPAGDQAAASALHANPVVSDKPCEKARAFSRGDQGKSQAAFAGTRWPENKHAGFADHDGTRMMIEFFSIRGRLIPFRGQGLSRLRQKYHEAGAKHGDRAVRAR